MRKLINMSVFVMAVLLVALMSSCSGDSGVASPTETPSTSEQVDPNGLGSKIARTIEWSAGDYAVDATAGDHERRVDVTDVRCNYGSPSYYGMIHKHTGTPSFVDDSMVVYAWQVQEYDSDEQADKWRVKWRVRYYDYSSEGGDQGWHFGDTYTIPNPANTDEQTYPSITASISTAGLMTVDVIYQQKYSSGSQWRIRHCRYIQATANIYSSFALANGFPKDVSENNDGFIKWHADVVYYAQPWPNTVDRLLCVYEDYKNSTGSERAVTFCYQDSGGSWQGYGRLDKTGEGGNSNIAMYPRIDVGIDDSGWTSGYDWTVCAVWQEYYFSGEDLVDIDIWTNYWSAALSPDYTDAIEVWFSTEYGSDYETHNHWDVFPYVDFDPIENQSGNRFVHIMWTHFKNGYTNATNLYWNTEMIQNVAWPVAIIDAGNSEEGLCTIAVKVGSDRAYACYLIDQSGDEEVGACYISYSSYASITTGGETIVSNGYASSDNAPIYGPVNAIRHASNVHVIWPDMQNPSDGNIYSDWN